MYDPNFKEGDIIDFCDEQYVVLTNNGGSGRVQENYKNGDIINFYWEYAGEKCVLVENGIDKRNLEKFGKMQK
jgi:hypothetical protein